MSEVEKALEVYKQRRRRGRPRSEFNLSHPEIRSIYIPDELQFVWEKYQSIIEKQGKSVSEAIVEYICNTVLQYERSNS